VAYLPGEKLFEELRTEAEDIVPTTHPKVKIRNHRPTDWETLQGSLAEVEALANCPDRERIVSAPRALVPAYSPARTGG